MTDSPAVKALKVYAGSKGKWDEGRNTSRVRRAPRGSLDALLDALADARDEEWYRWITDVWAPTRGSLTRTEPAA